MYQLHVRWILTYINVDIFNGSIFICLLEYSTKQIKKLFLTIRDVVQLVKF
jgi:hypothetical protein